MNELDNRVRLHLYRRFIEVGAPASVAETAEALGEPEDEVARAYRRLEEGHVIVLAPGTLNVWMANPVSAVPTPFRVETARAAFWGNCIWDALGIPAMLGVDGRISTRCPDCQEPLTLVVARGRLAEGEGVAHFAVPAAHWWDNIGYT